MNALTTLPIAADIPLTAGSFLKASRKQAGLTIPQVARRLAHEPAARQTIRRDLERLEGDVPGNYTALIRKLERSNPFPLDRAMFGALWSEVVQ